MPSYKSFCWSLGTTSFRMKEFNLMIEKQLDLLSQFWLENSGIWDSNSELQEKYYDFIREKDFIYGYAQNKSKDAREKTSGLVDIGLLTKSRVLTNAGLELLRISKESDFSNDNILQISKDSLLYIKQLLKTSIIVDREIVRPYVIAISSILELNYITYDEFTYLLPLINNKENYKNIIEQIRRLRSQETSIDDIIIDALMSMDNYQTALNLIQDNDITEDLIMRIGFNRKSKLYDKPYFNLYNNLKKMIFDSSRTNAYNLFVACDGINGSTSTLWKKHLFNTTNRRNIRNENRNSLNTTPIFDCADENSLKLAFFKLLHLFKAKATLKDYFDLNRRYLNLTDTIIFKDEKVQLDIVPKCFFGLCPNLMDIAFTHSDELESTIEFSQIIPSFGVTDAKLYSCLEDDFGIKVDTFSEAKELIKDIKQKQFDDLINSTFTNNELIQLLTDFENRNDSRIQEIVTTNADIPTIFEYITAIIWYKISGQNVRILDFMNLSLDANLLPKTHASGGGEDITFHYDETKDYPKHTLLIEVTLSERTNQRRMEMEPVSRHLGNHLLTSNNNKDYAIFISSFLHLNVISDFRTRKNSIYYSNNGEQSISGMKIIPLETKELKSILLKDIKYNQIYKMLELAFHSKNDSPKTWYEESIANKFHS